MRKILAVLMLLPAVFSGCSQPEITIENTQPLSTSEFVPVSELENYVPENIFWEAHTYLAHLQNYAESQRKFCESMGRDPDEVKDPVWDVDEQWEDEAVQTAIAKLDLEYPLCTNERIEAYAREIYDIVVEMGYVKDGYCLSCAWHYADGTWQFTYEPDRTSITYDGGYELYISEQDGHLICCKK